MIVYSLSNRELWHGSLERLISIQWLIAEKENQLRKMNPLVCNLSDWWVIDKQYTKLFCRTAESIIDDKKIDLRIKDDLISLISVYRAGDVVIG
ncbi:MAG: hypothetical protein RBT37_08175 [Dissulfurispiraceae bacterium]|nr:hypothetical protein [Dissulfurispiraceae bacterium]